jgi:peptide/nickel transport system ATP-binding protein
MTLLQVENLSIDYLTPGGSALHAAEGVSFSLEEGRTMGIVGESGCGKTTVIRGLLRLLPQEGRITSGSVLLKGRDLMRISEEEMRQVRWREISMVFQGAMNSLNPVRTVEAQIIEALRYHNVIHDPDKARERCAELLEMVGISKTRARQYPHEYSGGMRQRAIIAMSLACAPDVLIADEPTTALDVMIQAQILDLLDQLKQALHLSIILVTHDLGLVAEICDDVLVMYGGVVAEYGSSDAIFNQPQHPYTKRLLNAFPNISNLDAELASIPGAPPPLDKLPPGCRFEPRCLERIPLCQRLAPPVEAVRPGHYASCHILKPQGGAA